MQDKPDKCTPHGCKPGMFMRFDAAPVLIDDYIFYSRVLFHCCCVIIYQHGHIKAANDHSTHSVMIVAAAIASGC